MVVTVVTTAAAVHEKKSLNSTLPYLYLPYTDSRGPIQCIFSSGSSSGIIIMACKAWARKGKAKRDEVLARLFRCNIKKTKHLLGGDGREGVWT